MRVEKIRVYDPFMDGVDDLPPLLQVSVSGIDLESPSYEEERSGWKIKHYKRFLEFESLLGQNDEDEVEFNTERVLDEPVFPVTASVNADSRRELYMRVSEVRRLLRRIGRKYECVPDPTFVRKFMNAWHILDTDYLCVECLRDAQHRAPTEQIERGRRVQVDEYLLRTLCKDHEEIFNTKSAASRQR